MVLTSRGRKPRSLVILKAGVVFSLTPTRRSGIRIDCMAAAERAGKSRRDAERRGVWYIFVRMWNRMEQRRL